MGVPFARATPTVAPSTSVAPGDAVTVGTSYPPASFSVEALGPAVVVALAGFETGPHILAPHLGGNLVEIPGPGPAGGAAPTVTIAPGPDVSTGAAGAVGTAFRSGGAWLIPVIFPSFGSWTVTANGTSFVVPVAAAPTWLGSVGGSAASGGSYLIGIESPLAAAAPNATVVVDVASAEESGSATRSWAPFDGHVSMMLSWGLPGAGAGTAVVATETSTGRYRSDLTVPSTRNGSLVVTLATTAGATLGTATLPISLLPAGAWTTPRPPSGPMTQIRFNASGFYLISARGAPSASGGFAVEATTVDVAAPTLFAMPRFPPHVALTFNASFSLTNGTGPIVDPGAAWIGWEMLDGTDPHLFAAVADGRGNVSAYVALPQDGSYRIRLAVPLYGYNQTFSIQAAASTSGNGTNGTGGTKGADNGSGASPSGAVPRPWWNPVPSPGAPGAIAAGVAAAWALAFAGWRPGRRGGGSR
ncbi:MAG: hypothetical protein ACYDDF_06505 [Thermoplasmatota archaeon]